MKVNVIDKNKKMGKFKFDFILDTKYPIPQLLHHNQKDNEGNYIIGDYTFKQIIENGNTVGFEVIIE